MIDTIECEPVAWRSKNATPPGGYVVFQQYPQALVDCGKVIECLYTESQLAGAVEKAKAEVIEGLLQEVGEPAAWQLPGHVYCDIKEAEYDWRHDPVFDNTGYCPEPLYSESQLAGAVEKLKQDNALKETWQ